METIAVTLPTGFAVDKRWHRTGWLRPLNGVDEEIVNAAGPALLPVERITLLLSRGLTQLGPKTVIAEDDVRALTVGDRDALLLHLRRLMYGDKIQSVLTCPQAACKEQMDLELAIGDLLVPPNEQAQSTYAIAIQANGDAYHVKFRLPTGADQEAVAQSARHDPEVASKLLLQRCLQELSKDGAPGNLEQNVPAGVVETVAQKMAELDPQADILLNVTCPACHTNFGANFDIGAYFFKELTLRSQELYQEVAILALHYHWSEREILHLPHSKRRRYLTLLAEVLNPERKQ